VDWPDAYGIIQGTAHPEDRLLTVADLAIRHVQYGCPDSASLRALAVLLLSEFRLLLARPSTDAELPPKLRRMQEYILSHIRDRLSVKQIASVVGISPATAERLFRRHTGQSVGQWILSKRMSAACELLRTTNTSVTTVARTVGIEDPYYFSRLFSRTYGLPPSAYSAKAQLV
jgi:transcriptional regulator GlxA family with amidase domain